MKYIIEHFGSGMISGAVAVTLISLFIKMLQNGGMIHTVVVTFLTEISG